MIARRTLRRLVDERGQSLVLTLLVLFVLAIVLSTVIILTSSNQRNSSYQKAAQTAFEPVIKGWAAKSPRHAEVYQALEAELAKEHGRK